MAEIWLPEVIGKIDKTLKAEADNLLKRIKDHDVKGDDILDEYLYDDQDDEEESKSKGFTLTATIIIVGDSENGGKEINEIEFSEPDYTDITGHHVRRIENIVDTIRNKGSVIRWLKYTKSLVQETIDSDLNLYGMNCAERRYLRKFKDDLDMLGFLAPEKLESFTFKYEKEDKPNILFSSDSGYHFLAKSEKIKLKDQSIVTAPHHRSGEVINAKVYSLIKGQDLIFVRSNGYMNARPCQEYKNLLRKYCTLCNTPMSNHPKPVVLVYKNSRWETAKSECKCR